VSLPAILTKQQPHATLTRFCGPAAVNLRAHGRSFLIRSGYCEYGNYWHYKLYVGLARYVPAAPDKFFGLAIRDPRALHGGTFTRTYASMQLAGHSLRSTGQLALALPFPASAPSPGEITGGTVTVAKSLRSGTFVFHLRDATAITGSWTCGEKPYNDR
jgi:hypothetical protein